VLVNAPRGTSITLLSDQPAPVKITHHCWYVLWGLIPVTKNSTAQMIGQMNLAGMRVREYFSPVDFILDIVLAPVSLHTNTVIIEGQAGKARE
jgi:hypothetical protein